MESSNLIQLLDKWIKDLEMNKVPQTLADMQGVISMLKQAEWKKKGKLFEPLHIEQLLDENKLASTPKLEMFETRNKINEIIKYLNDRYSH
jgi:hypothetical protein